MLKRQLYLQTSVVSELKCPLKDRRNYSRTNKDTEYYGTYEYCYIVNQTQANYNADNNVRQIPTIIFFFSY